ncbi:MAG TPA: hypothetical protein VHE79_13530 [Spirochaetia bacterium]
MRLLIDADCLIKITRAGFKEQVTQSFTVTAPKPVVAEVLDQGGDRPDARAIRADVERGAIKVEEDRSVGGDNAIVHVFNTGAFDLVGTDDRRLIRRLTALGIPCVMPAVMIYHLVRTGVIERSNAQEMLACLAPLVSGEELQMARFLLEGS